MTDITTPVNHTDADLNWYGIRVTYCREMQVKVDLDSRNIENFLPMKYAEKIKGERKVRVLVPAIHNLIFMRSTAAQMKEYMATSTLPIRFIRSLDTRQPIVIPERQMRNFIAVAGNYEEQIMYIDCDTALLKKGQRVRVTGGIFEGIEGEFVRVGGDRRVLVKLAGIAAVATAFIHPSLLQLLDDPKDTPKKRQ